MVSSSSVYAASPCFHSVAETSFADEFHHIYNALQHLSPPADLLSVKRHLRSHEKVLDRDS